ncbi:MAG: PDDEXK nuclease domain-containing protein [Ferruginibacter sp.]
MVREAQTTAEEAGWGAKIIDRLAVDLKQEFPDFKGLSVRNLKYMRAFAEAYPGFGLQQIKLVQQPAAQLHNIENQQIIIMLQGAAQLPWGHHQVLLDKVKPTKERAFYIHKAVENGWSRDVMVQQIETGLYARAGNTLTNFKQTLPGVQSDLAQQTIKNTYVFDFLGLTENIKERELERGLILHLQKFMLELGKGFAYVGNQKNLVVAGDDFFLDLLFYNYQLHCFVVFELKVGDFKPEYAGKLNFYINTVNEQLKGIDDKPTIGVLLCKTPNETVVEYSLQNIDSPIGVAKYELARILPANLRSEMPTVEELEMEIEQGYEELKTPSEKKLEALKEKLGSLKGPEVRQSANTTTLFKIFDKSLLPLFQLVLKKMEDLKDLFMGEYYFWQARDKNVTDINLLSAEWKEAQFLEGRMEYNFYYRLDGFKKAGIDAFNISFELRIKADVYWWGITLINYNEQQPFLKKLYGEQLTKGEMDNVIEIIKDSMLKEIDWKMEEINKT